MLAFQVLQIDVIDLFFFFLCGLIRSLEKNKKAPFDFG